MTDLIRHTARQWWSLLAVLVLTGATLWLYLYTSRMDPVQSGQSTLPELAIDEPSWYLYNQHGRPEKHVQAQRLEQWSDQEAAYLVEPRIQLWDQQQRQWHTQARQGWLYPDHRPIVLEQQVVLRREPARSELVVKSEQLRIARSGDWVETDAAVVLQAGSWHFTATGLRGNLGGQQLELLGQVRGIHE